MEISKKEIFAVEQVLGQITTTEGAAVVLSDLQLSLVGGGFGDVVFG